MQIAQSYDAVPRTICLADAVNHLLSGIEHLVEQRVKVALAQAAAEEAAAWATCFGSQAPKDRQSQLEKIVLVASTRAVTSEMRASVQTSVRT